MPDSGEWGGEPLPGELAGSEGALDAMFADPAATLWPGSHKGPVDVVYFLSHLSKNRDDWELRHSLRSIVANFPDLGRVFIVGHRPELDTGRRTPGHPRLPHQVQRREPVRQAARRRAMGRERLVPEPQR